MISQYFTRNARLLIVLSHWRFGLIQFELGARFLDQRSLFFQLGLQHFHPFLLPLDGGF